MNRWLCVIAVWQLGPGSGVIAQGKKPITDDRSELLASRTKEIFRAHCFECHGGTKTNAGVKILDRELLVKKEKIVPGKPDDSYLFQLVTATDDSKMPPEGQPPLNSDDIATIRKWIAAGASAFPADAAKPLVEKQDPAFKDTA